MNRREQRSKAAFKRAARRNGAAALLLAGVASCGLQTSGADPNSEPVCENEQVEVLGTPVFIVPHPDDEILGFGGLLATAVRSGAEPLVVIVTDGEAYCSACAFWKHGAPPADGAPCTKEDLDAFGAERRSESVRALSILGVPDNRIRFLGYADGDLPNLYDSPERATRFRGERAASGGL